MLIIIVELSRVLHTWIKKKLKALISICISIFYIKGFFSNKIYYIIKYKIFQYNKNYKIILY